jgi:hypothetical protein
MNSPAPDPAFVPLPDSVSWFESGPDLIHANNELAALVVRLGMASNMLTAQAQAGVRARRAAPASHLRAILTALVTTAAFTNEAIRLAQNNMKTLRRLATVAGTRPGLLDEIGQLCSGKHASADILSRARNQICFHWDAEVIAASVKEFERNQSVIWLETNAKGDPLHRLAAEVLAHALLLPQPAPDGPQQQITDDLDKVASAVNLITEFFLACIYGYFNESGAAIVRRAIETPPVQSAT